MAPVVDEFVEALIWGCWLSDSITETSARSLMDRASDYGSEGWKFESSRARETNLKP
jgi:hypothetical protein